MIVRRYSASDELEPLCDAINAARWDDANAISHYEPDTLRNYVLQESNLFLACFGTRGGKDQLLGIASGAILLKPYGHEKWLYVDEIDVCADHRRRGVGTRLMQSLTTIAEDEGCEELWLGTEEDNAPALALYRSLKPDSEEAVRGFTYETDE